MKGKYLRCPEPIPNFQLEGQRRIGARDAPGAPPPSLCDPGLNVELLELLELLKPLEPLEP